jgi:hypothetical protein
MEAYYIWNTFQAYEGATPNRKIVIAPYKAPVFI